MTDTPMQQTIFGDEEPMTPRAVEPNLTVPRRAGWRLIAGRNTPPRTWHRLTSAGPSQVVTACGVRGHVVDEDQRTITLCPTCEALQ